MKNPVSVVAIKLIRQYQKRVSPKLGQRCKYQPTCSEYMILAIEKHGLIRGAMKGWLRLLACTPYGRRPEMDYP
jgi:hypothetical protein